MEAKTTEWRPGPTVCRCCLTEGCYKDISTEYFWMGKREVYSEMLSETLDLNIAYSQSGGPNSNSRLICEPCISRLRDATDFKRQVLECERSFMQYLDPVGSGDIGVSLELDKDVKIERVKDEKTLLDDDDDEFVPPEFGDEDDDDLDDQPLTKLASKIPKKESVDVLDLLDNAKITEKRKSSSKSKSSPAKKSKLKKEVASSSKVKPEPRKKKGARSTFVTSIWQLTVPERNNAATFIQYTSVQPFIFMGSSFKCFFCMQYFSEPRGLLEHTKLHEIKDRDDLLEKYIPKGKRTLQVDISKLNCILCEQVYPNLNLIRDHLKTEHDKHFMPAGNGMTEYNMELKNGYYVCHICNKEFHSFALLNSHMNCHVGKVVCECCGVGFLNQHLLMKHKESHFINKFKCQNCEKTFTKKSQVKYHTEIVHKGRERIKLKKCPICTESFKEHYSKMVHLKVVHGITKSFQCHICKTNFSTRRALTEHTTRYHTEKYKCEVCCKCFSIESKLKQHMRGHTGERNFVCNICKNAYMHKMTLQKHMRSHNAVFKFNCSECTSGFHNKSEYNKHIRQWHFYGDE